MSKPGRARFKLDALRDQASESLGVEPGFVIELDDGSEVTIPHPMFIDDDMQAKLDDADSTVELAKTVLGDEVYEHFRAQGGRANDVALAWQMMQVRMQAKLPDGNPTRR